MSHVVSVHHSSSTPPSFKLAGCQHLSAGEQPRLHWTDNEAMEQSVDSPASVDHPESVDSPETVDSLIQPADSLEVPADSHKQSSDSLIQSPVSLDQNPADNLAKMADSLVQPTGSLTRSADSHKQPTGEECHQVKHEPLDLPPDCPADWLQADNDHNLRDVKREVKQEEVKQEDVRGVEEEMDVKDEVLRI